MIIFASNLARILVLIFNMQIYLLTLATYRTRKSCPSVAFLYSMLMHFCNTTDAAARETLEQVMAEALSKSGSTRSAVRAVCLAVSGVNHPTDQQRILNWLRFDI